MIEDLLEFERYEAYHQLQEEFNLPWKDAEKELLL
jgi:hypothetical protein